MLQMRARNGRPAYDCSYSATSQRRLPSPPTPANTESVQYENGVGGEGPGVRGGIDDSPKETHRPGAISAPERCSRGGATLEGASQSRSGRIQVSPAASDCSYVVDFACVACKVAIEVDGGSH